MILSKPLCNIRVLLLGGFALGLIVISGCSPLQLVNAITLSKGSTVSSNVPYGTLERQTLDIYKPVKPAKSAAVIVFFYGGAWQRGEKRQYEFVARRLARAGHYVVIPDYRLYPEVTYPKFVEDGAAAVEYIVANLSDIASDNAPVFLMGHSAGAHIALLIALNSERFGSSKQVKEALRGAIGLSGPYDFLPLSPGVLQRIFPEGISRSDSQPVNHVDPTDIPVFLGQGTSDRTVWPRNAIRLADKLKSARVPHELNLYEGVSHAGTLTPFIQVLEGRSRIPEDVLDFIDTQVANDAI